MNEEKLKKLKDGFYDFKLSECGDLGRIAQELVNLEGYAVWIPRFVAWLYQEYEVKRK